MTSQDHARGADKTKFFTINEITAQKYILFLQWIKSINFIYKSVCNPSASQENINCSSQCYPKRSTDLLKVYLS